MMEAVSWRSQRLLGIQVRPSWLPCDPFSLLKFSFFLLLFQVMETKDMLYIVTEFAKNGEMFGELHSF